MYPFTLESPSHFPPHPTPLGSHRAPDLSSLCYTADFHWLSNFTHGNVYVSKLLTCPTLSFPYSAHKSVLCVCISIAALQTGTVGSLNLGTIDFGGRSLLLCGLLCVSRDVQLHLQPLPIRRQEDTPLPGCDNPKCLCTQLMSPGRPESALAENHWIRPIRSILRL